MVAILVFSGCLQPAPENPVSPENGQEDSSLDAGELSDEGSDDEQLLQKAIDEGNPDYCAGISSSATKGACFESTLTAETVPETCGLFLDFETKRLCYVKLVLKTEDPETCETISDSELKDKCYMNLISKTKNIALCENVMMPTRKEKCLTKT